MINMDILKLENKRIRDLYKQCLKTQLEIIKEYEKHIEKDSTNSFTRCNTYCKCIKQEDCVEHNNYDTRISDLNFFNEDDDYIIIIR